MVHKYSKMRRSQARVRKLFERLGGVIWFAPHTRFSKDIFNLFDFVLLLDGETYFGQVKSNSFPPQKVYEDFARRHKVRAILINVRDRRGIVVRKIE